MDASSDLYTLLRQEISVIESRNVDETGGPWRNGDLLVQMKAVIDELGRLSAVAQELKAPITSWLKLMANPSHRLYVLRAPKNPAVNRCSILGILRVGPKRLFIVDLTGRQIEMNLLCVLDFYVHESAQRNGHGYQLFEYMLQKEQTEARCLGYDRPSAKLMPFLKRHYQLFEFTRQPNKYVVFHQHPNLLPYLHEYRAFQDPDKFVTELGREVKLQRKDIHIDSIAGFSSSSSVKNSMMSSTPIIPFHRLANVAKPAAETSLDQMLAQQQDSIRTPMEKRPSVLKKMDETLRLHNDSNAVKLEVESMVQNPSQKVDRKLFDVNLFLNSFEAQKLQKSEYQRRYGEIITDQQFYRSLGLDQKGAKHLPPTFLPAIESKDVSVTSSKPRPHLYQHCVYQAQPTRRMFNHRPR